MVTHSYFRRFINIVISKFFELQNKQVHMFLGMPFVLGRILVKGQRSGVTHLFGKPQIYNHILINLRHHKFLKGTFILYVIKNK